jgi:copper(I)-binding protein
MRVSSGSRAALVLVSGLLLAASPGPEELPEPVGQASSSDGSIAVLDAVSHPTRGTPMGVVYLRIENHGDEADRLVSVQSSAARRAQLHETVHDGETVKMERRSDLEIPSGGEVELAPGGLHIMLIGVREPLRSGQKLPLRLEFERAGSLQLWVPVVPLESPE